jgi:hypothetical protein
VLFENFEQTAVKQAQMELGRHSGARLSRQRATSRRRHALPVAPQRLGPPHRPAPPSPRISRPHIARPCLGSCTPCRVSSAPCARAGPLPQRVPTLPIACHCRSPFCLPHSCLRDEALLLPTIRLPPTKGARPFRLRVHTPSPSPGAPPPRHWRPTWSSTFRPSTWLLNHPSASPGPRWSSSCRVF